MLFTGVHLPTYIGRSLHLVGQMTIPLLLLSLGFALSKVQFRGFREGDVARDNPPAAFVSVSDLGVVWATIAHRRRTNAGDSDVDLSPQPTINILMGA